MRKIREVLRLKYECGRSHREISAAIGDPCATPSHLFDAFSTRSGKGADAAVGCSRVCRDRALDMRWSFDIRAGLVRERLGEEPRSGDLFFFVGRRRARAKILFFDKSGYCLLYKRLDRGTFRLPEVIEPGATSVCIDPEKLALLLEGLDLPDGARSRRRRKVH